MTPYIEDAIRAIKSSPHVRNVRSRIDENDSGVVVTADFDTRLPSTWRAAGVSPTGVRAYEEVEVYFPVEFPRRAPLVSLRPDFNASLPHINPHKPGQRVPPCILQDDLLEALHSEGIGRLTMQIADWLERAGTNSLIDPSQGWEPMRRMRANDVLLFDADIAVKDMPKLGGLQMYDVSGWWANGRLDSIAYAPRIRPRNILNGMELRDICENLKFADRIVTGKTMMAVCWPVRGFNGNSKIYDQYEPDTVENYEQLLARAVAYGCNDALDQFTRYFNAAARDLPLNGHLPIYVALAVRRPFALIGMTTEFELLVYRLNALIPSAMTAPSEHAVFAVSALVPFSPQLMRRTSGLKESATGTVSTFVGCGSLGSKLMLHTARAGHAPELLIDKAMFAPHNSARHTLHPFDAHELEAKSAQLAKVIRGYRDGKMPVYFPGDVQDIPINQCSQFFSNSSSIIINTTGSAGVRKFLADADVRARVVEVCAMNLGKVGLFTLEGSDRNPSTMDVVTFAYEQLRIKGLLDVSDPVNPNLLQIGIGCNSVTLRVSDARLSLIASGAGQALLDLYENGIPKNGKVSLGQVGDDGMSINWEHHNLGSTQFANLTDTEGWTVRILESAHLKIISDVAQYPNVETGGIIVGRVSPLCREIIVTDVLAAPADSMRSRELFTLGAQGRANQISAYEATGKGVLWCLGTWHSHLGPFGPSPMDISTANELQGTLKGAVLLLIRRPDGYSAVVRQGS